MRCRTGFLPDRFRYARAVRGSSLRLRQPQRAKESLVTATDLITLDDVTVEDGALGEQTAARPPGESSSAAPADLPATPVAELTSADPSEDPAEETVSAIESDGGIGVLTGRLDAVDARVAEFAGGLQSTGAVVDALIARATTIEEAGAEIAGRLTGAEGRLDSADAAARIAHQQANAVADRLAAVDSRIDALGDQLAAVQLQQADHERALADVTRTIAAEVERHTTDALVDTRHNLQLAVNSIAQLSLAMAESSRDLTEDVSAESATALLDSFRVDLDAILGQLGFSSLDTTVGDTFDPHRHRALKRVTTSDPAQDKVITRVIRDGYLSSATGRILLFADVEVSRHRP